jgi:hypothetical protein
MHDLRKDSRKVVFLGIFKVIYREYRRYENG